MRYGKILMFGALLLALGACRDDDGVNVQGPPPPAAVIRFINAGTDWGTVDFRFVDRVQNLPTFLGVDFRGHSGAYQRLEPAGQRLARVFPYSTNAEVTRRSLLGDLNLNFEVNNRYTLVYAGRDPEVTPAAPTGEHHRLHVINEPMELPAVGGNNIGIRVLHAAVGHGDLQVFIVPVATATAATPANYQELAVGQITVSYLQQSAHVTNLPARNFPRTADTAGQLYRFVVTAAGAPGTPLFAVTPNLPGTPAPTAGQVGHGTVGASPGVQIPGSLLTAVLTPAAPARTGRVATAQVESVVLAVDRPINVDPAQ